MGAMSERHINFLVLGSSQRGTGGAWWGPGVEEIEPGLGRHIYAVHVWPPKRII